MNLYIPQRDRLTARTASQSYVTDLSSKVLWSPRSVNRFNRRYRFSINNLVQSDNGYILVNGRNLHGTDSLATTGICLSCGSSIFPPSTDGGTDQRLAFLPSSTAYDNRTALIPVQNQTADQFSALNNATEITFSNATVDDARISQLSWCDLFEIPGDLASWTPVGTHCRTYSVQHTRSQQGEWIGAQGYDMGEKTTIKLKQIPASWMEENYDILCNALTETPFYLQHSDGSRFLAYLWSDGDIEQPVYSSDGYCTFSFRLVG